MRNLAAGLRRRAELGGSGSPVGYGPDIFGHVAQLPQLLRLAGIDHALVWRGVPQILGDAATAFRWEAPDGSTVRTEYLYGSYANGRSLPADGPGLVARARSWDDELGPRRVAGLLLMNGGDQRMPEPWVAGAVAEGNDAQDSYHFEVTDLGRWLDAERAAAPDAELPVWRGELRSAAGAPVLAGVISNRVDVRGRGRRRRAGPRTPGGAAAGAVPAGRRMGGGRRSAGRCLGPADRQQRPRFRVRLLQRSCRRSGAGPLCRGAAGGRGRGRSGAGRPCRRDRCRPGRRAGGQHPARDQGGSGRGDRSGRGRSARGIRRTGWAPSNGATPRRQP